MLATFAQLTDAHVRDEESPARVPFLDRLGGAFRSTFRPHEALSPQVLAAAVRAVNRARPDAVAGHGRPRRLAPRRPSSTRRSRCWTAAACEPDTGARGYDGVQQASDPDPLFYRPDLDAPRHPGLMAAAQRPFAAPGLAAPWLPAVGNHDVLVQGEVPPTARIDAVATGARMVVGLDPALLPTGAVDSAAAVDALLAAGRARAVPVRVPADPARRLLRPAELLGAADGPARRAGRPARRRGPADARLRRRPRRRARACIVLDTADRAGGSRGRLLPGAAAPGCGRSCAAPRAAPSSSRRTTRSTARTGGEEALAALDATPGVVAVVHGNGHRNSDPPAPHRAAAATGSSARPRSPTSPSRRGRSGCGAARGGYVLETWMLDHDGAGLAGAARELAFLDAQGGRPQGFAGGRGDRNARLFVPVRG